MQQQYVGRWASMGIAPSVVGCRASMGIAPHDGQSSPILALRVYVTRLIFVVVCISMTERRKFCFHSLWSCSGLTLIGSIMMRLRLLLASDSWEIRLGTASALGFLITDMNSYLYSRMWDVLRHIKREFSKEYKFRRFFRWRDQNSTSHDGFYRTICTER